MKTTSLWARIDGLSFFTGLDQALHYADIATLSLNEGRVSRGETPLCLKVLQRCVCDAVDIAQSASKPEQLCPDSLDEQAVFCDRIIHAMEAFGGQGRVLKPNPEKLIKVINLALNQPGMNMGGPIERRWRNLEQLIAPQLVPSGA